MEESNHVLYLHIDILCFYLVRPINITKVYSLAYIRDYKLSDIYFILSANKASISRSWAWHVDILFGLRGQALVDIGSNSCDPNPLLQWGNQQENKNMWIFFPKPYESQMFEWNLSYLIAFVQATVNTYMCWTLKTKLVKQFLATSLAMIIATQKVGGQAIPKWDWWKTLLSPPQVTKFALK